MANDINLKPFQNCTNDILLPLQECPVHIHTIA